MPSWGLSTPIPSPDAVNPQAFLVELKDTGPGWFDVLGLIGTLVAAFIPIVFFPFEFVARQRAEKNQEKAEKAQADAEKAQRDAEEQARIAENRYRQEVLEQTARQQADELDRQQRSQAEQVHVWTDFVDEQLAIYLLNTSSAPVYRIQLVVVIMYDKPGQTDLVRRKRLLAAEILPPTGTQPRMMRVTDFVQLAGHGADSSRPADDETPWFGYPDLLLFEDAVQRSWMRKMEPLRGAPLQRVASEGDITEETLKS